MAPLFSDKDRELFAHSADWIRGGDETISASALHRLATVKGIDFATAAAYQSVLRSPRHGAFMRAIDAMHDVRDLSHRPAGFRIALVPGAFHREYPGTGADGRLLLAEFARLGYLADVLPLASFRRPAEGAQQIQQWLAEHDQEPVVFVSLSTGGSELKLTLAEGDAPLGKVIAWIDFSGILEGTALIDWLTRRWLRYLAVRGIFWWRGFPLAGLEDLRRGEGSLLAGPLELPDHLLAIHVVGFPLREHLSSPWARRGHERLAAWGPNDGGGILLGDAIHRPGLIYPIWGADHYLRPAWDIRRLIARLVRYVEEAALCPSA